MSAGGCAVQRELTTQTQQGAPVAELCFPNAVASFTPHHAFSMLLLSYCPLPSRISALQSWHSLKVLTEKHS